MPKVIQNGRVVADNWQIFRLPEDVDAAAVQLPLGSVIVPLSVWQVRREELTGRPEGIGVWLAGNDDPATLADDLQEIAVVAVEFPKFTDGRGYSIAVELRTRFGYTGQLRAVGQVLRDQFNYLSRCGFDTLEPAEGRFTDTQLEAAVASLSDFTEPYQASVSHPQPLFRRHDRSAA